MDEKDTGKKDGSSEDLQEGSFSDEQGDPIQTESSEDRQTDKQHTMSSDLEKEKTSLRKTSIKTEKKRSPLRHLKWILLLLVLSGIGAIFSPLCKPTSIVILGNNNLQEGEVIEMGNIPMDKSMYLTQKGKIEKNLMANPYVRMARMSRKFPNRLIIDMNMREEVATVNFQEGFVVIDHTGFILRIEQDVTKIVKPLITGLGNTEMLKVGDMLEQGENSNFRMILDLISNVQNAGLINNISEMNLEKEDDIFLITTQGLRVLLGKGEDLTYKLNQLGQILVDLHTKGIRYGVIDMRYNSYPVYREK